MKTGPTVITVGNFDGVHVGHAELVRRARVIAGRGGEEAGARGANGTGGAAGTDGPGRVVVLTFDPHPLTRLRPEAAPAGIMGFARRVELLKALGADEVVRIEPTSDVLNRTAEQFVRSVVEAYRPVTFVEGKDFRFGRGRAGDMALLREMGSRLGFAVEMVEPVEVVLEDQSVVAASSTLARWLVRQGRVRDAAAVLGRSHELNGVVVQGDRRGRTIGFATANLRTEDLRPGDGVYAAVARLADGKGSGTAWGRSWPAAVNVGTRPTFAGVEARIEAHLIIQEWSRGNVGASGSKLGASGPGWAPLAGLPEYGWPLRLELVGWVRDQVKFESVPRLVEQIGRDRDRAERIVQEHVMPVPERVEVTA